MKPPWLARRLVGWFTPPDSRAFLLGDLFDRFREIAETDGPRAANAWYWRQALSAVSWSFRAHFDSIEERSSGDLRRDDPSHVTSFRRSPRSEDQEETMTCWLADAIEDGRFAVRTLVRSPAFTAVAVLTLSLGTGANTAVFMAVARALVDPLPYDEPESLVVLYGASSSAPDARGTLSAAEIEAIRQRSYTAADVAAFGLHGGYTFVGSNRTDVWAVTRVGASFFGILGVEALLGRTIGERDTEPGAPPVVVLSHGLWTRQFGADPSVIGRSVRLNDVSRTVVGVMPADFVSPYRTPEIWIPLDLEAILFNPRMAHGRMLTAVARLADETELTRMRNELSALARETREIPGDVTLAVNPVRARDAMVGEARIILLLVMGAALLLLALACVNLAALSLTRWTARRHELSVRSALGAGPGRLVRQTLAEGVVIGTLGGFLGVAIAASTHRIFLMPTADVLLPPMGTSPRMSAVVLAFAAALALGSGVAFGILPAFLSARTAPGAKLAEGRSGAGRRHTQWGRALVAAQAALAVLLLVGAGLLGRSLYTIQSQDVGYRTDNEVLTFRVNLSGDRYSDPARTSEFFRALLEQIRTLPGVEAAGMITISPWNGWYTTYARAAGGAANVADSVQVVLAPVTEGYFEGLEVPVRSGRGITADDRPGSGDVAVVSERMSRQLWPAGSPLGARVKLGGEWVTVVGVVADVRETPTSQPPPVAHVSAWQRPQQGYEFVVRASGPATPLIPGIRETLRERDPEVPLIIPRTMAEVFATQVAPARVPTSFLSGFALLALVLAAMGIYGVVSYSVTARGREIGIRAALGGQRSGILLLVLWQGVRTAAVGAAAGLVLAAFASRVLASMLYGVSSYDLATFVAAPLILIVAGAAASLLPALRATRIDPVEAMRTA